MLGRLVPCRLAPCRLVLGRLVLGSRGDVTAPRNFGAWSSRSVTRVVASSMRWKVTTPAWWVPLSVFQATRSSRCCSVISASNSRVTPAIFVVQWVRVGVTCWMRSTPSMNCGNDSSRVHWS